MGDAMAALAGIPLDRCLPEVERCAAVGTLAASQRGDRAA
jgi:hypothetical protein